jgi:translocation and assembly module TamA
LNIDMIHRPAIDRIILPQFASRLVSKARHVIALVAGAVTLGTLAAPGHAATAARADSTRAVMTPPVKVEILGISGALKSNVKIGLSIEDKKKRKKASEEVVRHLHSRAEEEIQRALQPYGYYRPIIKSELITGSTWIARYRVDPGPPLLVDSVLVQVTGEGAEDPKFQKLVRDYPLHKGKVLLQPTYEASKTAFETAAAEGGFLDASFIENEIVVDLEKYMASIFVRFDTGPRHYFGDVAFDHDVLDRDMLVRFPQFHRGDVFDFRKLLELQTDLSSTGYFTKVEVNPNEETVGHRTVPIDVSLAPAKRLRFTGGVGYGTDEGARVRLLTEMRRLNRAGHRARIDLQYGLKDKRAGAQYFIPWPNPRTDVLTLFTGYQDQRTVTAHSKVLQGGVSESRLLGKWRVVPALTWRRENFVVGVDSGIVRTLVPENTWTRIRSDDALYTKNGDRVRLKVRGAHEAALSDVSFVQGLLDGKLIHSFGPKTRGLARMEVGATGTDQFRSMPPTLRFFAGGTNSVRGYSYNSLGPRDELRHVIGGPYLLTASLEADQMVLPKWGVAAFFDTGNAMNRLGFSTMKRGVGVGLRWVSPVGLVRTDFGWGLDREGTPLNVHLAVGAEL